MPTLLNDAAQRQLREYIDRIERLEEEKTVIGADIREIKAEMKGAGYDMKAVSAVLRMRKKTSDERAEEQSILDVYLHALGMLADTPLGQYAMARDGVTPTGVH